MRSKEERGEREREGERGVEDTHMVQVSSDVGSHSLGRRFLGGGVGEDEQVQQLGEKTTRLHLRGTEEKNGFTLQDNIRH